MRHASNEKRQVTKLERSEKKKLTNTWEYWKLTTSNKGRWNKKLRKNISGEAESYSSQNLIKGINTWAVLLVRYSGQLLKRIREEYKQMDQRTIKSCIRHYIPEMTLTNYVCQEKMEEEESPVLMVTLTYRYNNLKTTYKSVEEDWLQPPETIVKKSDYKPIFSFVFITMSTKLHLWGFLKFGPSGLKQQL